MENKTWKFCDNWRILRWAARQDRSDTAPAYFLDTIAALTAGLVGPTEAEAKR